MFGSLQREVVITIKDMSELNVGQSKRVADEIGMPREPRLGDIKAAV